MRKFIFTLGLTFLLLLPLAGNAEDSAFPSVEILRDKVSKHWKFFQTLYPREEGTPEEKRARDYIKEVLSGSSYSITELSLEDLNPGHSFSKVLEIRRKGLSSDEIVLSIPLSSRPLSKRQEDGSLLLASVLTFLESFQEVNPQTGLRVLLLGGEYGPTDLYPLGSREYLDQYYPEGNSAFLYLDLPYPPEEIFLDAGGAGSVSPAWMVRESYTALSKEGLNPYFSDNINSIHKLGLRERTPVAWYLLEEYPTLRLAPKGTQASQDPALWGARFAQFLSGFILDRTEPLPVEWDSNYLFFTIPGDGILITEWLYILVLIAVFLPLLIYPVLSSRGLKRYLKVVKRNIWALPFLLGLIFLFLTAGTALSNALLSIKGSPYFWKHAPLQFFVLKILFSLFLFSLLFHLRRFIYFSYNSSFYSALALFLLILSVLCTLFINITLSYYFLWALFFTFLFSILPWRWGKVIVFLLSFLMIVRAVFDFFTFPAQQVSSILIFSWINGNLLLSLTILPFFLMLIRLDFLFKHPRKLKQKLLLKIISLAFAAGIGILVTHILTLKPYNDDNPQKIQVTEVFDNNLKTGILSLKSESRLGSFSISLDTEKAEYSETGLSLEIPYSNPKEYLDYEITRSSFLEREYIQINLMPLGSPERISISFLSQEGRLTVFDSNFPFAGIREGEEILFFLGSNPPLPLALDATIPSATKVSCNYVLYYNRIPYEIRFHGENKDFIHTLTVTGSFPLEEAE